VGTNGGVAKVSMLAGAGAARRARLSRMQKVQCRWGYESSTEGYRHVEV
jgi:hypothetical protein